jgi:4-amino-4-deoxy-L-arabinose transferase-like glycosyltransferase
MTQRSAPIPIIASILLLGFGLRLALALVAIEHPQRAYAPDTGNYIEFAYRILNGTAWEYPSAFRTPGYPFFLAANIVLWGETPILIIFAQVIISCINILLTYKIGKMFFSNNIAILAALLLALNPESITHSFFLLTETLFTLCSLLGMFFLFKYNQSRQRQALFWAGIWLGMAILTRPLALYYPLLILGVVWYIDRKQKASFAKSAVVFSLACLALLVPWVVRNNMAVGVPTVSTISARNLYFYNALSYEASRDKLSKTELREKYEQDVAQQLLQSGLPATEGNESKFESKLAREIILSDPFGYAISHMKHNLNSLLPETDLLEILNLNAGQKGTLAILNQKGLMAAIQRYFGSSIGLIAFLLPSILLLGVTYLGWGTATVQMLWEKRFFPVLVLSLPIFYGLLLPGAPSNPRFRVPVMPFICILAAAGIFSLWQRFRQPNKPSQETPRSNS